MANLPHDAGNPGRYPVPDQSDNHANETQLPSTGQQAQFVAFL